MNLKRRGEKRWPSKLYCGFDSRVRLHGFNNLQALSFTVVLRLLGLEKRAIKDSRTSHSAFIPSRAAGASAAFGYRISFMKEYALPGAYSGCLAWAHACPARSFIK